MNSSYPFSFDTPERSAIAGSLVYDLSIFKFQVGKQYSVFGRADFVNIVSSMYMILYPSFLNFSSYLSSFCFSLLISSSDLLFYFFFQVILRFFILCILQTLLSRVQFIILPGNCFLKCLTLSLSERPVCFFKVSALTIQLVSCGFKNLRPNLFRPLNFQNGTCPFSSGRSFCMNGNLERRIFSYRSLISFDMACLDTQKICPRVLLDTYAVWPGSSTIFPNFSFRMSRSFSSLICFIKKLSKNQDYAASISKSVENVN